jgi:hypothetical protein
MFCLAAFLMVHGVVTYFFLRRAEQRGEFARA